MTTFLCVADIHDDERKLERMVEFSRGCDAVITCGDDFDKSLNHTYESSNLLRKVLPLQNRGLFNREERERSIKADFKNFYVNRARVINQYYKRTGLPAFGTLGNHDPAYIVDEMRAVKYLVGAATDFKGLAIAGLPATGAFVLEVRDACPEQFPHLSQYCGIDDENQEGRIGSAAQNLLCRTRPIDIFITHKSFKKHLQDLLCSARRRILTHDFEVDAGAAAVDKKFRPTLNIFGHYHSARPYTERSQDGKRCFAFVSPNSALKVTLKDRVPVFFETMRYF